MNYKRILNKILEAYKSILGDNLVGIYIHGSIAFGCFNPSKSDINFMAVVKDRLTLEEKEKIIRELIALSPLVPAKGLGMSIIRFEMCKHFVYPTPFELHSSNAHLKRCQNNIKAYGTDKDLATHFTVIRKTGIGLYGEDIDSVFGNVQTGMLSR